jgi:hypothetical protein
MHSIQKSFTAVSILRAFLFAAALLFAAGGERADASPLNLIADGTFQATSLASPGGYICQDGSGVGNTCTSNLTDWSGTCSSAGCAGSSTPASLLFAGTTTVDVGAWNGNRGLYPTVLDPPTGGNVVAIDGGSQYRSSISQTITGLKVGDSYSLSFYQGAAQQETDSGATTEQWQVTFGTKVNTSTLMNNASESVVGWNSQSMFFIATSATQTLTFLALGTPSNEPPVVLLADVALTDIPEPTDFALLGGGALGLVLMRRRAARTGDCA